MKCSQTQNKQSESNLTINEARDMTLHPYAQRRYT